MILQAAAYSTPRWLFPAGAVSGEAKKIPQV
jgi:hypothetical protein